VGYNSRETGIDFKGGADTVAHGLIAPVGWLTEGEEHPVKTGLFLLLSPLMLPVFGLAGIAKGVGYLLGDHSKIIEENRELAEPIFKKRDEELKVLEQWLKDATLKIEKERDQAYEDRIAKIVALLPNHVPHLSLLLDRFNTQSKGSL